jgi:predicted Zn-dependent peptidase
MDVLADMLMNAKFDKKEFEKEKWVIIQEMKMYEDNPARLVNNKWKTWYFWDNNFGRLVIWNQDTVSFFTSQDLYNYKSLLYTKDNLIISIAGNWADKMEIKELIAKNFWSMKEKKSVWDPKFPNHKPNNHESLFKKWTEQNHLIISAKGILWTDERKYAAEVLASVLGWNMSSRLYQNIRTKEWLCYYISAFHWNNRNYWIFMIRAWIDKNRFDFGLKRIKEEIEKIATKWVTQKEFEKAIWYLQWNIQMWIETSDEMASFLWTQYLIYNKIETLDDILKKYKKLTLDDVNQLSSMLDLENCYIYHIE